MEGFGWFTYETMRRIVKNHPEHEFVFFFDRKFDQKYIFADNVTGVILNPQARHPILYKIWFNWSVKKALKKHKIDLFLSPDGYLSLTTKVKQLAVIHDINFEHYPQDLPKVAGNYYLKYFPKFARKATRIATVSEFSKKDIAEKYQIKHDKIDVCYNGVNEDFGPVTEEIKIKIKSKYSSNKEYFVFIGSLHPRKNLVRLFKAFNQFKNESNSITKLVIIGDKYWWTDEMKAVLESLDHKNEIVFTGHLNVEEVNKVIASSMAMVYVSYFEGFGIPVVEAMRCEVPVITSNVTSMPEVAGNAAFLVDPFNVDDIRKGLKKIAEDKSLRQDLVAKGKIRCQNFNWDNAAKALWESIEKCFK